MSELIYKDLSFKIVGLAYKIDNLIGYGHPEKVYSDALAKLFTKENIAFKRELYAPIKIDDDLIARRYLDFLVDDKIVVELKTGNYRLRDTCNQVFQYLKIKNLSLGIVVRFTKNGVLTKRVVNIV